MKIHRREFLKAGASSVALLAAGCDKLPRELRGLVARETDMGPFKAPVDPAIDPLIHVLNRVGFGARPGDYDRARRLAPEPRPAAEVWLDRQLAAETIDDIAGEFAVRRFETLREPPGELFEYQPELLESELSRATLARSVHSERQLFEAMVQFWSDHFNIDPSKGDGKWLKVTDDREVIRRHALGRFAELLRASALSPAMLWYLDGRVNRRSNPDEKPNENYARELLELHTLGVHGGYTQRDVMEVARCLSGWTVRSVDHPPRFQLGKVEFDPAHHDFGEKELLGDRVMATANSDTREEKEKSGRAELDQVLEIVAGHPATARHIAWKLCRRFIAEEPPEDAVSAVSAAFTRTAGDIRATLRALFATDEFWQMRGNKLKRPFQFVASALRVTGARTDTGPELITYLERMGHAPFHYPTPDGYPEVAAPWLGTLLWRWNFAVALSQNQIKGTRLDESKLRKLAGGDDGLMAHVLGRGATAEEVQAYKDSGAGLALLIASPGFQRC